jgi:hypothetical protein
MLRRRMALFHQQPTQHNRTGSVAREFFALEINSPLQLSFGEYPRTPVLLTYGN